MLDYTRPADCVDAYFLGQFIPWDSHENALIAKSAGMQQALPSDANWWKAENLDNAMTGLHDHLMYRKYGYGRFVAQISVDIRKGLIDREEALALAKKHDGFFPSVYADVAVKDVLERICMTGEELFATLDQYTNWALFDRTKWENDRLCWQLKEWAA